MQLLLSGKMRQWAGGTYIVAMHGAESVYKLEDDVEGVLLRELLTAWGK